MRRYVVIISALFISLLVSQEGPPAVAVLDFEPNGIPDYAAATLTERLRSEIANTKAVRLTDRKLLEKDVRTNIMQVI